MTSNVFDSGWQAAFEGTKKDANPFKRGTVSHELWLEGWQAYFDRYLSREDSKKDAELKFQ